MKNYFKKIFCLTFILSTLLMSCNNDDDNVDSPNSGITKKVVTYIKETNSYELDSSGNPLVEIQEGYFKYDEKYQKLLSLGSIDNKIATIFNYENNLITSIKYNVNGLTESEVKVYYKNNLLNYTLTEEEGSITERHDYIYDSQNKLIRQNICSGSNICDGSSYIKLNYTNNNISKINDKSWFWSSWSLPEHVYDFTFEKSKNPFTNMQYILKVLYNDNFYSLNENNISIKTEYRNNTSNPDRVITYTYILDKDDYPTTIIGKDQTGRELIKTEYKYNQ